MFAQLAQYKILERIGAGGLGEVYRARDTSAGRTVALKIPPEPLIRDGVLRNRLLRAADACRQLSHPNVAALYEAGEDQSTVFLAIEFAPGESLQAAIGGQPMNPRRALDLAAQIAEALAAAHACDLVHGDLRPANVIVTPKGRAKLLDVGLSAWTNGGAARVQAADRSAQAAARDRRVWSVAPYLSPEQARGIAADRRSDLFSLGIVAYEMLTGTAPFAGSTIGAVVDQIVDAHPTRPSSANRALSPEIDAILGRMLRKEREERYATAAEAAADLLGAARALEARRAAGER
jgi:eukaryotic-like serine/threonine-protein kinase